jgi:hypothetical protein
MRLPNTPTLSRFAQRCTTAKTDVLTVSRVEAQQVSREYQDLLEYCVQLQDQLIAEKTRQAESIEIVAPNW